MVYTFESTKLDKEYDYEMFRSYTFDDLFLTLMIEEMHGNLFLFELELLYNPIINFDF